MMKLIETYDFSNFLLRKYGIFNAINTYNNGKITWLTKNIADILDTEYYFNFSGDKNISKMFNLLINRLKNDELFKDYMETSVNMLASIIINKYADKWNRLYKAYVEEEYKALDNYKMVESGTDKESTKITNTQETNGKGYGFNSSTAVNVADNSQESTTTGALDDNVKQHNFTRSGNIGVTTSQQMLQSELDLRNNYDFFNHIFIDVDNIMCSLYYN